MLRHTVARVLKSHVVSSVGMRLMEPTKIVWIGALALLISASITVAAEEKLPEIPTVTAEDQVPGGCVDCHVNKPENNMDVRISTHMEHWFEQVEPKLLDRVRAIAREPMKLTGRHPRLPAETYRDIPNSCGACHGRSQTDILPLAPMLHALHLNGGKGNHFLTIFKGRCTHCHKFNAGSGEWTMPSGPEKQN